MSDRMQELVGRLTALDAEATETLKVIAYFDALINGHASAEVLLRGAAVLSGCPAGFVVDATTLRVDGSGVREPGPPGDWPSRRFGDGGTAWIERSGKPHANDDMILERLSIALDIALERTSPVAASRRALRVMVEPDSSTEARLDAARRLHLDAHTSYRVIATAAEAALRGTSVVVDTDVGAVRLAIALASDVEAPDRAGVGIAAVPDLLPRSWASALIALRLSTDREPVVRADDLGAVLALAETATPLEIPDVATVASLIQSQPGAAALLDAIATAESLRAAGSETGLHHSTVQAKAAHYSDVLGFDLRSPQGRVRLSIAITLYRLATTRFD